MIHQIIDVVVIKPLLLYTSTTTFSPLLRIYPNVNTMDLINDNLELLVSIIALSAATAPTENPVSHQTGTPGSVYLEGLLDSSPQRIYGVLRMQKETFLLLCKWLDINTPLTSSWRTSIREQVAMFLWTVNYSASQRQVAERFQHSGQTVHQYVIPSNNTTTNNTKIIPSYFHEVLQALLTLQKQFVNLPTADTPLCSRIADDPKYATYFTDCVGALDGTHIDVHVSPKEAPAYRNRKGQLSQNVLAVCDFDMNFTYVLAGWEGSAHDGSVLRDAMYNHAFKTPENKYWLGDAGYSNTDTVLVPYRSTRYHLKEQQLSNEKPQNSKELFNLRHSSLRNVVERIFGVLKRKYRILQTPSEYSMDTQTRIILACTGLHNFVRSIEGQNADTELDQESPEEITNKGPEPVVAYPRKEVITSKVMDKFRDELAERMWADYQRHLARRTTV